MPSGAPQGQVIRRECANWSQKYTAKLHHDYLICNVPPDGGIHTRSVCRQRLGGAQHWLQEQTLRAPSAKPWTGFWRSGRGDTYAPEPDVLRRMEALWAAWFATFPDGAKLLDLATGAGHIVRVAVEAAAHSNRRFEIHGVDLADISDIPRTWAAGNPCTVRFHGKVDLPFPSVPRHAI